MSSSQAPAKSGRELVIAGGIVTGTSIAITAIVVMYFVINPAETMSMVLPLFILGWLFLAVPTWVAGIAMLGSGRQRQRGPVRGAVIAWIVALGGGGSVISIAIFLTLWGVATPLLEIVAVSIPVLTIASLVAGAWLVWGKPQQA